MTKYSLLIKYISPDGYMDRQKDKRNAVHRCRVWNCGCRHHAV